MKCTKIQFRGLFRGGQMLLESCNDVMRLWFRRPQTRSPKSVSCLPCLVFPYLWCFYIVKSKVISDRSRCVLKRNILSFKAFYLLSTPPDTAKVRIWGVGQNLEHFLTDRQREKREGREFDWRTNWQTDQQTDRLIDRQTDKQTERQTDI